MTSFCARPTALGLLGLLLALATGPGCQTISFYTQAIHGQSQVLHRRQSIASLITRTNTPQNLKIQLSLVLELRTFAEKELGLPANGHYLTYADLRRRYALWNVYAAPEFSLKAKRWWYPVVGSLKYRGYFSESRARRHADKLEKQGYDVHVGGVAAYSTLGWFRDPVLNTFIDYEETDLAELIFHELTHQRLFIAGDTDFNEALATTVAEEGLRRWLERRGDPATLRRYREEVHRREQFVTLVMTARTRLEALYAEPRPDQSSLPCCQQERLRKQDIITQLREEYAAVRKSWDGAPDYDGWFAGQLNNAQLNTVDTYYQFVPGFRALLQKENNHLESFFKQVDLLSRLRKEQRHARLEELGKTQ